MEEPRPPLRSTWTGLHGEGYRISYYEHKLSGVQRLQPLQALNINSWLEFVYKTSTSFIASGLFAQKVRSPSANSVLSVPWASVCPRL